MADQTDDRARAPADERDGPDPQEAREWVLALVNSSPSLVYLKDTEFRYRFVNRQFEQDSRKSNAEMYGRGDEMIMPPEFVAQVRADELKVMEGGTPLAYEEEVVTPKGRRHFSVVKLPVYGPDGALLGIGGFVTDITERKLQELEQQRMIAAQREALRELSTPLLPIAEGVLAVPLVGVIDSERAGQIVDNLLHGIASHRAHTAILDITGIRMMDTEVARALLQAARASKLVGARVVLTGISPEVAQTLVTLGVDLSGITTLATLANGIAFALREA
ncbi:PAS domain-containing protein [Nannocystis radixulma]|uniref:PAS domain-containing protein n=1 Tax=Nannocystis radixulma TaxID=2995305 RepID=A0ABT5B6G2_9BACT|nr:PAS domain-containing protein [Nannocystis radixulma]MDC0669053.1 PAS domain-containing protein [Nannocystis radixulma]